MEDLRHEIIRWHSGKKKRAIADFAKALGVASPRVSHWLSGRNWPDEDIQPKICKLLGIAALELAAMRPQETLLLKDASRPKYAAGLEARVEELTRDVKLLSERVAQLERSRRPLSQ